MVNIPSARQVLGGFLIGEGGYSIVFSGCKSSTDQLSRLARMGIGYYLYKLG